MGWLTDPRGRRGTALVAYRIGNALALLLICGAVAAPLAWLLLEASR